jgi:glycosyltransferase involved in cell wall biosynthesis
MTPSRDSERMKIAILNDRIYHYASGHAEAAGGAERVQWLLARALAASGWSVRVALTEIMPAPHRETLQGVEFVGLADPAGRRHPGDVFPRWYRFLSNERVDWLYWMCADHRLGPVFEMAHLTGARAVFSLAHDADVSPREALSGRRSFWPLYAWGLKLADRIFVQHDQQLENLPPALRGKAAFLPSIVNLPSSFRPHAAREPYVAWVAMLREPKRPDLLVEIARRTPGVRYVVVGGSTLHRTPEGYSERMVEALKAVPNIEFLGRAPFDQVNALMSGAALFLSTSDEEGFPSTFLESWAAATPVVSLTVDPNQVLERHGAGCVMGSVDRAVSIIPRLLAQPAEREAMGVRGRRYIEENHTESAVVPIFSKALALPGTTT